MIRWFVLCGTLVLSSAILAEAQSVSNTSYVAPDGSRVLRHTAVVQATEREVWDAFTTTEGVRSWAVPVAAVDFRVGGIWESNYNKDAVIGAPGNIRNKFLSYVPMRMLSMQAINAPPTFQHPEVLQDIFTVVELEPMPGGGVRVTISMVGFKDNEAHNVVYGFFSRGNALSLQQLHDRFAKGPRRW